MFYQSLILNILITLIVLLKAIASDELHGLFGGVGGIVNDTFYVFGGMDIKNPTDEDVFNQDNFNQGVYSLNLKDGVRLNEALEANWKIDSLEHHPLDKMLAPSVIQINNNSAEFLIIGGAHQTLIERSVRIFDIKTNTWKIDKDGGKFIKGLNFPKSEGGTPNFGPLGATLNQNDLNPDELVLFGGEYLFESLVEVNQTQSYSGLIVYNSKENQWKTIGEANGYYISGHNSIIHNGNLMIFGGKNIATNQYLNFNKIISFNIKDKKWYFQDTIGKIPERIFTFGLKKVGNYVYILGGATNDNVTNYADSSLHILDLNTFSWETKYISGFISTAFAILEYYNGHLLYTFGSHNNLLYSNTQIINLKNYTLVNRIPSMEELESLKPKSQLPAIIGGSIAGFIGLILLIILIYLGSKKIKREIIKRTPPPFVSEPTCDKSQFIVNDPNFSFDNDLEFDNTMSKSERQP
ncbi:hypothetical protein K502DRAFT_344130 [Neoconidiobolus thromboides FSU 785]|nr:hypothetical protein K502DRAFT_344130 [Neoconidiobolus thromboides FSU 785]